MKFVNNPQVSNQIPQQIGYAIALLSASLMSLLCFAYIMKIMMFPQEVLKEFKHPISRNFFATPVINIFLFTLVVEAIPIRNFAVVLWVYVLNILFLTISVHWCCWPGYRVL